MLKIVKCSAASGKTEYVYSEAQRLAHNGERIFFIVPEQDTVNAEGLLLSYLGNRSNIGAETLNFSRLPNRVFRETGGISHRSLDKAGRALVTAAAVESVSKTLGEYAGVAEDTGFILKAASTVEELKNAGIYPDALEELCNTAESKRLKNKLSDISLIYSAYQRLIKDLAADPSDDMMRLSETLEEYDFFADCVVFIDGFYDFTKPQYDIIYRILYSAKDVYITFIDGGDFPKIERACEKIASLAVKSDTPYKIVHLDTTSDCAPELSALQKSFRGQLTCESCENIHITRCPTVYDECTAAARQIRRLMSQGTRCREIAVCARGAEAYSGIIEEIFSRYSIPVHFEVSESIISKPLVGFVLSSLEVLESGWRLEKVKALLKSGFCNICRDDIFLLENYADFWNISGTLWIDGREWDMNPEGYTDRLTEWGKEVLDRVNEARKKLISPLLKLAEGLRSPDMESKLAVLYTYLRDNALEKTKQKISALRTEDKFSEANEETQLWNFVMDAFDQLKLTFGGSNMGRGKLYGYLKLIFSEYTVACLPACLDQVLCGDAAFIRPRGVKHLFLLGVNDGVFPAAVSDVGLLSDRDKMWLLSQGAELSSLKSVVSLDEEFYFYLALSQPSESLWLSYHTMCLSNGKTARPSSYIDRVKGIFPSLEEETFTPESLIPMTGDELFALMLERPETCQSLALFFPDEAKRARMAYISRESLERRGIIDGGISGDIKMTQAKFDSYKNCKYSYFLRYMLNLKEKKKADFSYSETGTFIHKLLEDFMTALSEKRIDMSSLSDKEIKALTESSAHEYIKTAVPFIKEESVRFRHMMSRICKFLTLIIKNIVSEFSQSSFRPLITEAKIGDDVKAYKIPLGDGSSMIFTGSIDRVDIYDSPSGKSYIRVVDYKTSSGGKKFSLSDIREGINVQMLVYLFSAVSGIKNKTDKTVPAGVLYVPAASPAIVSDIPLSEENIEQKTEGELKRYGLVLNEEEIIYAMEHGAEGRFIPARIGKNGNPLASSSLATLEQFGKLKAFLDKMFYKTAHQIRRGEIDVNPFCRGKNSCEYCPYGSVCRFEGEGRTYTAVDEKDFWRELETIDKE